VDVHSNGVDEASPFGASCGSTGVFNLNASPPQYGDAWQCEELAQRLYNTLGWYSGTFGAYAALIYSSPPSGMTTQPNGSITLSNVVPGDMVVTHEATYGHVFIVNSVNLSNDTISVVDQNGGDGGVSTLDFSGGSLTDATDPGYFVFSGIVHSPNNHNTNSDIGSAIYVDSTGRGTAWAIGTGGDLETAWQPTAGSGWTSWYSLGGSNLQGIPVVNVDSTGRGTAWAIGTDGHLYQTWQTSAGSSWVTPVSLGGSLKGSPAIYVDSTGRGTAWAIGTGGDLETAWQPTAGSGWTSWYSLGGTLLH
jgi:hypothetical protein